MLKGIPGYAKLFEAAYPDDKDPITMPNVVTAIAAFEATVVVARMLESTCASSSKRRRRSLTMLCAWTRPRPMRCVTASCPPELTPEVKLLTEIRDLLRGNVAPPIRLP